MLLTVSLSTLCPGLGHAYLGDLKTSGLLMGSGGIGLVVADPSFSRKPPETLPQWGGLMTFQTAWSYGLYAAYRDVRIFNRQEGYTYPMPQDSFVDIALAPFKWSVISKPEVWGGLLGSLALAVGVGYFISSDTAVISLDANPVAGVPPFMAFPIGISEETLFRGYLQPMLSEWMTPIGGITLSSLIFGAAHIPNAAEMSQDDRRRYYTFGLPLITGLGAYFGWLTYKNNSLK